MGIIHIKKNILLIKEKISMIALYLRDIRYAMKYSLFNQDEAKGQKLRALLLISIHGIEKGLSFEKKKENWGKQKVLRLVYLIEQYHKEFGEDEIFKMGINALNAYKNDENSCSEAKIVSKIDKLLNTVDTNCYVKDMIGVKQVTKPNLNIGYDDLLVFMKSRSSVRYYSKNPITEEEINKAIVMAQQTPTACNRQSCRVYVIKDTVHKKQLIDSQHGDQGWCLGADIVFVVTANQSYFNATYERYQMYIDGGLYAMNLVYGLHVQGIATCYKMYNKGKKEDDMTRKICGISASEVPIILILAGHYKEECINTPLSHRLTSNYEEV